MKSTRASKILDMTMRALRFGRHARLIRSPESMPPPLSAISGWAVAHGADGEFLQPAPPPSNPPDSDGERAR